MNTIHPQLRMILVSLSLVLSGVANTELYSQSLNGIYSDGEVSLHLEEKADGVSGIFIDSDGSYYEAFFFSEEEGLLGILGEFAAFIPRNSETMLLYIMPLDANEEPILEEAIELELEEVADPQGDGSSVMDLSESSWSPIKRFGDDFYPSYVLATATWSKDVNYNYENSNYKHYGDNNGYFGVSLQNFPVGSIVRIEIEGEPLVNKSSYTATITHKGVSEIFPIVDYDYEALKNVNQPKPVNFKYKIYINNQPIDEKLETVWVRSVNEALLRYIDHHGYKHKVDFIFAAYVNENEPRLDPILGQVLDYGIIDGWQGNMVSEEEVIKQVFALWYHFQKQGFKYSNIGIESGNEERSTGQVIRFVGEALNTKQANCIDGTVLFASFLHKIGLMVSIVLVPEHAYLAFELDQEGTRKMALETTMMGDLDLERSVSADIQQSWESFNNALYEGTENYKEDAIPGIKRGDLEYMEIHIAEARYYKIRPIK